MTLAGQITALVNAEWDTLIARIAELEDERVRELRAAYRRGYQAGYSTGQQGRPRVTNPERHTRGGLRSLLNPITGRRREENA